MRIRVDPRSGWWPLPWRPDPLALLLAALAFALSLGLELAFERSGVLGEWNVLFDADPNVRLDAFADGWNAAGRNVAHPNLSHFVNPPVRALAALVDRLGAGGGEPAATRRLVALGVAPCFAAAQIFLLAVLLRRAGLDRRSVALACGIAMVCFAHLIFASLPDHFVMSGALLAATLLLAHDLLRDGGRRVRWIAWIVVGVIATGVTLTNLAVTSMVFALASRMAGVRVKQVVLRTAILCSAVLAGEVIAYQTLSRLYDTKADPSENAQWVQSYWLMEPPLQRLWVAPVAWAGAFAPASVAVRDNRMAREIGSPHAFRFSLIGTAPPSPARHLLGFVTVLACIAGALRALRGEAAWRGLAVVALAVIAFHTALHAVWGSEMFLYTQHWQTASVVLLAANLRGGSARTRWLLVGLGVWILVHNGLLLREMFARLAA